MDRIRLFLVRLYLNGQNLLLALVHCLLFSQARNQEPQTILVYRTARLGDFVVAIPALAILRRTFPHARIVLLTTTSTAPSMQLATQRYTSHRFSLPWLPLVVPALGDDAVVLDMTHRRRGLADARRLIQQLKPDAVFVLPFSNEDGISSLKKMIFLRAAGVGGPFYGWRVRASTRFLRETQYRSGRFEHQVWGPLKAIMECSSVPPVTEKDIQFPITIDDDAENWSRQLWACKGWTGRRVVAVFPGGTFPHKRWPPEKFVEVCRALQKNYDGVFAIVGANSDRAVCELVAASLGPNRSVNLAGETSVMQLAAVLRHCGLFIGNDSGPAHLAAAAGCACVTLFSSTVYPGLWEPWENAAQSLRHPVPCEHCFCPTECPMGTRDCINQIPVAAVLEVCDRIEQRMVSKNLEYAV